jgi:hypothetical protein
MRAPAQSLRRGFAFLAGAGALGAAAWLGASWCRGPAPPETGHAIALDRLLVRAEAAGVAGVAECAACHQDAPGSAAPGGKAPRETVEEWRRSEIAAAGSTCVSCHADATRPHSEADSGGPSRDRGFYADARFATDGLQVVGKLEVRAVGVGHRLPTTTGVELLLALEQLDYSGTSIPGSRREGIVGRRVEGDVEVFDTRLLPGEVKTLGYEAPLDPRARALRARVVRRPVLEAADGAAGGVAWEEVVAFEVQPP